MVVSKKLIPRVGPMNFGQVEGNVDDMGWILAEERFREVFSRPFEYCEPWDTVQKMYGCFRQNDATKWAAGMNAIISSLNTLPADCSRDDLRSAFGIWLSLPLSRRDPAFSATQRVFNELVSSSLHGHRYWIAQ